MKKLIFILILLNSCFLAKSQSKYDSLNVLRNKLQIESHTIQEKIEALDHQIIKDIQINGYEIIFKESYSGQTATIYKNQGHGDILKEVQNGSKLKIIGKESIYYKVEIEGVIGYFFSTSISLEYPIKLLDDYKYRDLVKGTEKSYTKPSSSKSSRSHCASKQCSSTTKSGSRCKNRTTNCSGRCYRH